MDVTGLQIHPATRLVYILASGKVYKMISHNSTEIELACPSNQIVTKFEIDYQGDIYGLENEVIYKCTDFTWTVVQYDKDSKAISFKGKEKYVRGSPKNWRKIDLDTGEMTNNLLFVCHGCF